MNAAWNHIARSIFDRADVANVSLEELDYLVEEYPYFPVIHFLRTRKVLEDKMPESFANASRTALYFSNPHWLQYQLEGVLPAEKQELPLAEILTTPSQAEELSTVISEESIVTEAEAVQEATEKDFDDKRIFSGSEAAVITETQQSVIADNFPAEENQTEASIPEEKPTLSAILAGGEQPGLDEISVTPATLPTDDDQGDANKDVEPQFENESDSGKRLSEETEMSAAISKTLVREEEIASADDNEQDESFQVPIEPLYTIDYFASQGIRLKQEEVNQTDPLSVRLKSFTEWLKAMKKIHPERLDQNMGQEEENSIRVYAESSNEPREDYTEALAEVYLQQGLKQKATMVFEKLSLLDPSKSAYFAARIREIKEK